MIATPLATFTLSIVTLASQAATESDGPDSKPAVEKKESAAATDPTVASPLIQELLQNLTRAAADGNRPNVSTPKTGPRFRLSGLVLTSPTSGTAVITTQSGTIRLTLTKSGESDDARLPAARFEPDRRAAPAQGPAQPENADRPAVGDIDLSSSFSDGDSLFRVIDFRRGMILLEELPQRRLVIVR